MLRSSYVLADPKTYKSALRDGLANALIEGSGTCVRRCPYPMSDDGQNLYRSTIDTELSLGNVQYLPEYLRRRYLLDKSKYRTFFDIHVRSRDDIPSLMYTVAGPALHQFIEVTVTPALPITVTMARSDAAIPDTFLEQLYDDLFLMVQLYEEDVRQTTLYLAFMPDDAMVPEKERKSLRVRLFADSMLPVYTALMSVTFVLFVLVGSYAPLIFVGFSVILSLASGEVIARSATWELSADHPELYLLQYHLTPAEFEQFQRDPERISAIRTELYEATLAQHQPITCPLAGQIFAKYGIACDATDFTVKTVDLFHLVATAAKQFGLPVPRIVVTNTILPNAAAAGPAARFGTLLVTTGILTQLDEEELRSIIGHELSHFKAHDTLVMGLLSNLEYLLRFYVFWPYLFTLGVSSYLLYSLLAIGGIYFLGKVLEGRADLDSVKVLGHPHVLAEALKKIAFTRLFPLNKREPEFRGYRKAEWFQFEPHPPVYFRIARLEQLHAPEQLQNTFLQSIQDSLHDLFG